ncbi:MAG: (d)CMP kinase [Planctomycetia bacterium]|nr:(d)CMP kinase [Planctomycetia bacterium]
MIITLDGPAGSGKSTVAEKLAEVLGFDCLPTGRMYRAVALAGLRRGVDWSQPDDLLEICRTANITMDGSRVFLDGEDVSQEVETREVTAVTKYAAGHPKIREWLTHLQREYAKGHSCVTEGRDQGTEVFPNAEYKFFLEATPEERARRRFVQKQQLGEPADYEEILRGILQRDDEDAHRPVGAMRKADDAMVIVTDGMTADQVVSRLKRILDGCRE